jgi:hypothetical protein
MFSTLKLRKCDFISSYTVFCGLRGKMLSTNLFYPSDDSKFALYIPFKKTSLCQPCFSAINEILNMEEILLCKMTEAWRCRFHMVRRNIDNKKLCLTEFCYVDNHE